MSLTRDEVRQIAQLAKLDLEAGDLDSMTRDLGSILDHMRELTEAPAGDIAPMRGVSEHMAPYREDEPGADRLQQPIDTFAPGWQDRFFVVPRLAALDADAAAERGAP
jgi:aspartyl-tRNA(Asn)/glutamyl-tRNA(Gln) amidotransferase subunit C